MKPFGRPKPRKTGTLRHEHIKKTLAAKEQAASRRAPQRPVEPPATGDIPKPSPSPVPPAPSLIKEK